MLLDITGVLLESSSVTDTNLAIEGSVEAVKMLDAAGRAASDVGLEAEITFAIEQNYQELR